MNLEEQIWDLVVRQGKTIKRTAKIVGLSEEKVKNILVEYARKE